MSKIEAAKKALEATQADLEAEMKEEKSSIVNQMRDNIVNSKISKFDLRFFTMKKILRKYFENIYLRKKNSFFLRTKYSSM